MILIVDDWKNGPQTVEVTVADMTDDDLVGMSLAGDVAAQAELDKRATAEAIAMMRANGYTRAQAVAAAEHDHPTKAVEADMTKVRRNAIDTALAALADLPEVEPGRIAVPWPVAARMPIPTADWADATLDTYQIEQLFATQATLKIDNIAWHLEHLGTADVGRNAHPNITLVDGEPRIHDGHHRLAALWLLGVVFANCWTLEP